MRRGAPTRLTGSAGQIRVPARRLNRAKRPNGQGPNPRSSGTVPRSYAFHRKSAALLCRPSWRGPVCAIGTFDIQAEANSGTSVGGQNIATRYQYLVPLSSLSIERKLLQPSDSTYPHAVAPGARSPAMASLMPSTGRSSPLHPAKVWASLIRMHLLTAPMPLLLVFRHLLVLRALLQSVAKAWPEGNLRDPWSPI